MVEIEHTGPNQKLKLTDDCGMFIDPFTQFTQQEQSGITDGSMSRLGHLE